MIEFLLAGALAALAAPSPAPPPGHRHEPPATASIPADAAEARRAEIETFRREFLARDRSYSTEARAEATARLARLEAAAESVSPAAFALELARIVALADNGHTVAFPEPLSRRFNHVPIHLLPFGDRFFVLRATTADADLLGAELLAIDGRPIAEVREVARTLSGGTAAHRDLHAPFFFESPEQMQALGVIAERDAATYRFAAPGGAVIERRLAAEPENPKPARWDANRWFYPDPVEGEAKPWRALLTVEKAPAAFREPGRPFRILESPDLQALVVELRQNVGSADHPIEEFLSEADRAIREKKPRHLILDMRMNGGGDLNTTRDFVQRLPSLVPGRIFALTSPWTFSAAISTVGYLKQAAPTRVTIVGEQAGDRLEFFAEGSIVMLPHSGLMILYATERHDYRNGCRGLTDCHGPVVRHPIAVESLAPAIEAPWTIEAYRAGRDPAMEAIAAALRAGG